jgi:hypothetical protein
MSALMHRYARAWVLLALGVAAVAATLLAVSILNREPPPKPRPPWLDPAKFQETLEHIRKEKLQGEELIRTSIKRNRAHFESILRLVEKEDLPRGGARFSFPKGETPTSLRRIEESFDRMELGAFCETNTLIHAERQNEVLFVKIVMRELGHAGTYSVLFTSKALDEKEIESHLGVPGEFERLEPQWWALVEYY